LIPTNEERLRRTRNGITSRLVKPVVSGYRY